jgi:hypothetical protein
LYALPSPKPQKSITKRDSSEWNRVSYVAGLDSVNEAAWPLEGLGSPRMKMMKKRPQVRGTKTSEQGKVNGSLPRILPSLFLNELILTQNTSSITGCTWMFCVRIG